MGHAVMTHAPIRLDQLPEATQHQFTQLMTAADTVTNNDDYRLLMNTAATIVGLHSHSGEIALCACPNCWACDQVFDANDPDAHPFGESTGYNLGRIQCPTCTDQHPATDEQ